jgi:dTDP-4-dehydrorhamnose reductase
MGNDSIPQRILVTGAEGMLGTDLCDALRTGSWRSERQPGDVEVVGLDLPQLDIRNVADCRGQIRELRPDCVIHCAGYTDVDGCTRHPLRAYAINGDGTRNVAEAAQNVGAQLVYISTDYVFDGTKQRPYVEQDTPNPINAYGESKLLGEEHVRQVCSHWQIVRTQWLFGRHGKNFVAAILEAAKRDRRVRAVNDQFGSPTYTKDLSELICQVIALPTGIYHATNSCRASWYDVAAVALAAAGITEVELSAIPASEWPTPTARPVYSVLGNAALRAAGIPGARSWEEAVRDFVIAYLRDQEDSASADT